MKLIACSNCRELVLVAEVRCPHCDAATGRTRTPEGIAWAIAMAAVSGCLGLEPDYGIADVGDDSSGPAPTSAPADSSGDGTTTSGASTESSGDVESTGTSSSDGETTSSSESTGSSDSSNTGADSTDGSSSSDTTGDPG